MAGHLSLKSLKSTIRSESDTLAAERWNVEKERQRLDNELAEFHKQQLERCKLIRVKSNAKAVDEYEKLLFKIRWAHPTLPVRHRNVIVEYCEHLLGPHSNEEFEHMHVLEMCREIAVGTQLEKASNEIDVLCNKIQSIAEKRDKTIIAKKSKLISTTEKEIVKNQGKLRWMMETNVGRKDRYWTIWFLTNRCMLPELTRLVTSTSNPCDINERDPDFGMTAIHYACKGRNFEIYKYLVDNGANIFLKTTDGRTCLHLAAQYSTKEIVGHLLTLGAFYDAKDNYGCMAIDLADQNKNKETFLVLDHWNKLIPPAPPATPPPEIDLSFIPDEYLATPKHIFDAMSLRLQMLTKRIDGEGVHSFDSKLEPSVEMRLCEKHALICIQEGFLIEGIKSLRRRWRVAKNLLVSKSSTGAPSAVAETSTDRITTINDNSGGIGSGDVKEGTLNEAQASVAAGAATAVNESREDFIFTADSAADIGRDLVEVLLRHKFEGFALAILCECVQLHGLEDYTLMCLHVRIAEIVLFLYDYLNKRKAKETTRSSYAPPSHKPLASTVISNAGGKSITSFISSQLLVPLASSSPQDHSPGIQNSRSSFVNLESMPLPSQELIVKTAGSSEIGKDEDGSITSNNGSGHFSPAGQANGRARQPRGSFTADSTTIADFPYSQSPGSFGKLANEGQVGPTVTADVAQQLLKEKLKELLALGHISANSALRIHYDMHTEGFTGQDAITLCPLLELSSEMYEREGRWAESLQLLEYAEVVSSRTLGPCHEETIRIMLVGVKLHLKCANVDAYKTACVKATDMSRRLDQLSLENPVMGDQLGRKCAEVLALSRLLEDYKEDGLDAEEDVSIVLPTSTPSAKNLRGNTAKQFVKEIKKISKLHGTGRSEFATDIRDDFEREIRQEAKRLARLKRSLESKSATSLASNSKSVASGDAMSVGSLCSTEDKPLSGQELLASANRILNSGHKSALADEEEIPRDALSKIKAYKLKSERSARLDALANSRKEEADAAAASNPINSDIITYKLRPYMSLEEKSASMTRLPPPIEKLDEIGHIPDAVYDLIFGTGKRVLAKATKQSKYTLASRFFSPTSAAARHEEVSTTVNYQSLEAHGSVSSIQDDSYGGYNNGDDSGEVVDEPPIKWYL